MVGIRSGGHVPLADTHEQGQLAYVHGYALFMSAPMPLSASECRQRQEICLTWKVEFQSPFVADTRRYRAIVQLQVFS